MVQVKVILVDGTVVIPSLFALAGLLQNAGIELPSAQCHHTQLSTCEALTMTADHPVQRKDTECGAASFRTLCYWACCRRQARTCEGLGQVTNVRGSFGTKA